MLNFESSIQLTRPSPNGATIKRMLDKADVAQRLVEEMDRVGVSPARLAEKTGVTIQAIYGWTSTGRFARKHYDAFRGAGFDLGYILTGQRTPSAVAEADTELPSLSQHDLDLIAGYRTLTAELQTAVWSIIDDHLRRQHPELAKAMGPRDIPRSLSAEPRLRTKQILAQNKPQPVKPAPARPKKEPR